MKNTTFKISGYSFHQAVSIQCFDMSLISGRQETDKKWLMLFDPESDTATLDHTMPKWYAEPAILVEAFAHDKIRKSELECLTNSGNSKRLAAEKYCLTLVDKHRLAWLKARKYYYDFRLRQSPNDENKDQYTEVLQYIENLLAKDDGVTTEYLYSSKQAFETNYYLTDFKKITEHEHQKWLVYYAADGRVFLSEDSPKWYRKLASLSEEVCMAEKYPELLEGYSWADKDHFDAVVEAMIIDRFTSGRTRKNYIEARIQMFTLIRDAKLNTIPGIQIALDYLIERQKAEA